MPVKENVLYSFFANTANAVKHFDFKKRIPPVVHNKSIPFLPLKVSFSLIDIIIGFVRLIIQ